MVAGSGGCILVLLFVFGRLDCVDANYGEVMVALTFATVRYHCSIMCQKFALTMATLRRMKYRRLGRRM